MAQRERASYQKLRQHIRPGPGVQQDRNSLLGNPGDAGCILNASSLCDACIDFYPQVGNLLCLGPGYILGLVYHDVRRSVKPRRLHTYKADGDAVWDAQLRASTVNKLTATVLHAPILCTESEKALRYDQNVTRAYRHVGRNIAVLQ